MIDEKVLVGRLEEESLALEDNFGELVDCIPKDIAIKIVNQLAEGHNNGWIPCSERLPDNELANARKKQGKYVVLPVLATVKRKKDTIVSKVLYSDYGDKHFRDLSNENLNVTAWRPLPEPYQPKGE